MVSKSQPSITTTKASVAAKDKPHKTDSALAQNATTAKTPSATNGVALTTTQQKSQNAPVTQAQNSVGGKSHHGAHEYNYETSHHSPATSSKHDALQSLPPNFRNVSQPQLPPQALVLDPKIRGKPRMLLLLSTLLTYGELRDFVDSLKQSGSQASPGDDNSKTTSTPSQIDLFGQPDDTNEYIESPSILNDLHSSVVFSANVLHHFPPRTFPQYGLIARASSTSLRMQGDSKLFLNTNVPFSAFICGVQGSGKSHTLSCMIGKRIFKACKDFFLTFPLRELSHQQPSSRPTSTTVICFSAAL